MPENNPNNKIVDILLILAGVFIAYQLLLSLLGGSWPFESIIIALIVFNLGITWKINAKLEGHVGWHKGRDSKKWLFF